MTLYRLLLIFGILLCGLPARALDFQAGQAWTYHTRPGERDSVLYIVKDDVLEDAGHVFHIYIDNLKIVNPFIKDDYQRQLLYAPIDAENLKKSLVARLDHSGSLPDISKGYAEWQHAYQNGRAGVFTMPVNAIISYTENAIQRSVHETLQELGTVTEVTGEISGKTGQPGPFFILAKRLMLTADHRLFTKLLRSPNPIQVAMGFWCLVQTDAAAYAPLLTPFKQDPRMLSIDSNGSRQKRTVGQLATLLLHHPHYLSKSEALIATPQ